MYGTVATFHVKPGREAELFEVFQSESDRGMPGAGFVHVYRMDDDPNTLMLVVAFESKEAYRANAESPEQHAEYERYRALLEDEPEWHDGEIIYSDTGPGAASA